MKFKMFSAQGRDGIVEQVNAWLLGETGIAIRRTETNTLPPGPENQAGQLQFSIWYDQDAP